MNQIKATVIADSISPQGKRLTTFELVYHRYFHSEFMTHRMVSKNSASSRAIPTEKLIKQVRENPMMPIEWGRNQKGMQAGEAIDSVDDARDMWIQAALNAADSAEGLLKLNLHKQVANRVLEPFVAMRVVATATEWNNFFHLRNHPDAQPEIQELARCMLAARNAATPTLLHPGMWHLPYITPETTVQVHIHLKYGRITRDEPKSYEVLDLLRKISVARCARVSYNNFEGRPTTIEEDLELYTKLVGSEPLHASPTEHQASPDSLIKLDNGLEEWESPELHGNLKGWCQYRKTLKGENVPG